MRPSTRVCQDIFVVASKRTPFGAFGGKLKDLKASELGAHAAKAALAELPEGVKVDEVFFGSVTVSSLSSPSPGPGGLLPRDYMQLAAAVSRWSHCDSSCCAGDRVLAPARR